MHEIAQRLFDQFAAVRYVAVSLDGRPELSQRPGIESATDSESDLYEELLVNPVILLLAKQRGEIDCGGMQYVVIRYGNFFQVVLPFADGHLSIAIESDADPIAVANAAIDFFKDDDLAH